MSGIVGMFNPKGIKEKQLENVKQMLSKLEHRGPDGTYIYRDSNGTVVQGQTYLEIHKAGGKDHSPILTDSHQVSICANGRFYDFKNLRSKLVMEGWDVSDKSDHAIALPLYHEYGLDFVNQLRGEFAFSLHDPERKRLLLVRDRFGVKPLFYHQQGTQLYWASEIKALLAHPDIEAGFSRKSVLHQLMQAMVPGTSAFEGIYAVKPGHMLIVDYSSDQLKVTEQEYWDLVFPEEHMRDDQVSAEDMIAKTRSVLLDAVAVRMDADYPVGAYLSGGIDSCTILSMASELSQEPVRAYTISFDHDSYDESAIAKEMAQRVGAEHEQILLTADELYGENYVNTLWHAERTFYNTLGVAKNQMSKKVKETGYRIALTGEGSDELFGGYPSFKRDMLLNGSQKETTEQATSYQKQMDETNKLFTGAILSEELVAHPEMDAVCGFTPSWIQPWMKTLEMARPLLHDSILGELEGYDPISAIAQSFNADRLQNRHVLDKAQYTWSKIMLDSQILNWGGDRVDMANGMESRPPFMDHKVVEMAVNIPPHMRIKGNTEKWVLREAVKNIIPETLYKREKFAFMAPPSHTDERKRAQLKMLIHKYMDPESIQRAGLFDEGRLQEFLEGYWADQDPVSLTRKDVLINHILSLHILWHLFIK